MQDMQISTCYLLAQIKCGRLVAFRYGQLLPDTSHPFNFRMREVVSPRIAEVSL